MLIRQGAIAAPRGRSGRPLRAEPSRTPGAGRRAPAMPSTEESCGSLMSNRWFWPVAVAVAVYAIWTFFYGLWLAFTQVCLCGLCLTSARLGFAAYGLLLEFIQGLLSTHSQMDACLPGSKCSDWLQKLNQWSMGRQKTTDSKERDSDKYIFPVLLVIVVIQILVSSETLWLVLGNWFLVLIAPILAVTLHYVGTPKVLLEEVLEGSQVSYAQGAAWAFYMGYLTKILAFDNRKEATFKERMNDYLTINNLQDENQAYTSKNRMLILVPMKQGALLSDGTLTDHDALILEQKKLEGLDIGGRKYGEIQVYCIEDGGKTYRAAIEEATPIRTAAHAVDDATAKFEAADFEEFAKRFKSQLEDILTKKQAMGNQIKLVPIYDVNEIRHELITCLKGLEQQEPAADEVARA